MKQVEPSPEASGRPAGPVYRDDSAAIQQELDRERARCRRQVEKLLPPLASVYAARAGRIAAGVTLLLGAALLVAGAMFLGGRRPETGLLTMLLLAAWPAALAARQLARAWARRHFARRLQAPLATTDDAHSDLARLRRLDLRRHAARLLAPLEPYSMAVALAGTTLLLPLSLHLLVVLLANSMESISGLRALLLGFDRRILLGMMVVGHCHVLLAVLAWRHGTRLTMQPAHPLATGPYWAGRQAYLFTVLSSVLSGVLLMFQPSPTVPSSCGLFALLSMLRIFLPPLLVAVFALFIPLLFRRAHTRVTRERGAVALALGPDVGC